jgi:hypothetical protein
MSPRPNASSLNRQGHETAEGVFVQIPAQLPLVIPAQAGIQRLTNRFSRGRRGYGTFGSWIPACAGMTRGRSSSLMCLSSIQPANHRDAIAFMANGAITAIMAKLG